MNILAHEIGRDYRVKFKNGEVVESHWTDIEIPKHLRLVSVYPDKLSIVWKNGAEVWALKFATPLNLYIELERRFFRLAFSSPHGDVWCSQFFDERPVL